MAAPSGYYWLWKAQGSPPLFSPVRNPGTRDRNTLSANDNVAIVSPIIVKNFFNALVSSSLVDSPLQGEPYLENATKAGSWRKSINNEREPVNVWCQSDRVQAES